MSFEDRRLPAAQPPALDLPTPRPPALALRPDEIAPAIRWFLFYLLASGQSLDEARATIDAATAAEGEGLKRAGLG